MSAIDKRPPPYFPEEPVNCVIDAIATAPETRACPDLLEFFTVRDHPVFSDSCRWLFPGKFVWSRRSAQTAKTDEVRRKLASRSGERVEIISYDRIIDRL